MGVPAWVWFVIAAVAALVGGALLLIDHGRSTAHTRERRRWAALRGWQFADADPVLPDRWRHGALARGESGTARSLVTGSLFTAAGRRLVHVFDFEQGGRIEAVMVAVHRRMPQQVVLELWLPTVEFPTDAGLDLVGPVGERYAFTNDVTKARPLITPELAGLADDVGADVPVAWIEDAWVAAAVASGASPARLERLLRLLGDLADLVDGVRSDEAAGRKVPDIDPEDIDPEDIDPEDIDPEDVDPQDVEPQEVDAHDVEAPYVESPNNHADPHTSSLEPIDVEPEEEPDGEPADNSNGRRAGR